MYKLLNPKGKILTSKKIIYIFSPAQKIHIVCEKYEYTENKIEDHVVPNVKTLFEI